MTEPETTPTPEPKPTLHQRILKVMDSLAYIQKGDKRVNGEYTFVSHDQVIQKLRPFLVDNGIILLTDVLEYKQVDFPPRLNKFGKEVYNSRTEATLNLRLVNADDPKDFIEGRAIGFGIDNGDKGPGKAISYAVKYFLLKNFCLETGDDPDKDADPRGQNETPPPAKKAPVEPKPAAPVSNPISEAQMKMLRAKAKEKDINPNEVKDQIMTKFGKASSKDLTSKEASELIDWVERWRVQG